MDNLTRDILTKDNYINPLRYISGRIVEYDMKAANVSILFDKGVIDYDSYVQYNMLPKDIREKEIGLLIKHDRSIYDTIAGGIKEYRIKFGEVNNIDSLQICRISRDAIYINTSTDLPITQMSNVVEFRPKSISNVMLTLGKIIIFVSLVNNGISIDVKGLGNSYTLHQNYMLNIIGSVIYYIERSEIKDALNFLSSIIDQYINKELDIGYYRNFNSGSTYTLYIGDYVYDVLEIDPTYLDNIDINCNLTVLRELWSICIELYNRSI